MNYVGYIATETLYPRLLLYVSQEPHYSCHLLASSVKQGPGKRFFLSGLMVMEDEAP